MLTHGPRWMALAAIFAILGLLSMPEVSLASPKESIPGHALLASSSRVRVKSSWLRSLLIKEVVRATSGDSARVEVTIREPWEDISLNKRPVSYRVLSLSRIASGRVARMRVELLGTRGRVIRQVWVSGVVSIQRAVWTAKRDIEAGEVLRAGDMQKEERDARQVARGAARDPREILGMSAKRSLVAGTLLRGDQFKKRILVRRGQKVSILLSEGPIRVVAPGKTLEKGAAGEVVKVLNLSSSRTVFARVSDPGTVLVEY